MEVTAGNVEIAFVDQGYGDQGYTGEPAQQAAEEAGLPLHVVLLPGAKKGFVLLPRRWVAERSFARAARFRRLAKDSEGLPQTLAGVLILVSSCLTLARADVFPKRA